MIANATLNCNQPVYDDTFAAPLKELFSAEKSKPSSKVLDFIFGFAGAYESIGSELFGTVDFMKN